ETPEYDFKGNVLTNLRQCIADSELLSVFNGPPVDWEIVCYRVDWTGLPNILDVKIFETNSEYDALNRVTKVIYPEDADSNRKIGIPTYNRAGGLQKVAFDGTDYVKYIAYNAKGQRLLIAHGNNVMTRYLYDNRTFRLLRQRSEKYTQSNWEFISDGNVRQDTNYVYDLVGNIVGSNEANVAECGIGGAGFLNREFNYDPLYRLLQANGRENSPAITPIWDDRYRSTNNTTTTAYTQHYSYDRLGNIQKLQHIGNNNFTRNFNYINTNNQLQSIDIGMANYAFSYDECGNQLSETTSRHFEWDFGNRLRSFYVQAGTSEPTQYAQYLYDASGTRVKKLVRTQGGDYTSTVYIDDMFEYKTDGSDEQNLLHIMDDQSRIAMVRLGSDFGDTTPAIKYNLEDHLGNSCVLLETNGALINQEEYYPFGETSFGSYAKKRYKFSGKERDDESGLYYCKFRYHSAWICRFISVDPLSAKYPYNSSYAYAENKVISMIELEGLEAWEPKNSKVDVMSLSDFDATVKNEIIPLAERNHAKLQFDCNDLALFTVMKYFEMREVEFSVTVKDQHGSRSYSSSDTKYKNFDGFYETVRKQVGSKYTKESISHSVLPENVVAGDMYVSSEHTYVLLGAEDNNPNQQSVIYGSGYYYGKGNLNNVVVDFLQSKTITIKLDSKSFKIARWNMLEDIPNTPKREVINMVPLPLSDMKSSQKTIVNE
ncbi:MAG TPA: RHS repeat-associated core domain-containing protein, partial [Crocinitomicaceae bacterium]|nr:RHS repeat-associated core domain-containing protein [Crocinitomicaceae bacterium]